MNAILRTDDLIIHDGEPTVQDLHLARLLGFDRERDIRKLVARTMDELRRYGEVCAIVARTSAKGGRPGTEYHLNQGQALLIAMKSDAPRSPDVRQQLIEVFLAWYRGQGAPVAVDPMEPASLTTWRLRLETAREIRSIFGVAAAARAWRDLGLPMPPAAIEDREPVECLLHYLAHVHEGVTMRERIAGMFRADHVGDKRFAREVAVFMRGDGFVLPNVHKQYGAVYAGTRWERPFEYWRRLPGAKPYGVQVHLRHDEGTYLPSTVLDLR